MITSSGWTRNWEKADVPPARSGNIFMQKTAADKDFGVNRKERFVQPENMKADMYDYSHIIDQTQAPGAEGNDQGNGNANQYLDTSSPHVPIDSKLSPAEQQILDEANGGIKKPSGIPEGFFFLLRSQGSNLGPSGYEPDELPLLYFAMWTTNLRSYTV